MWWKHAILRRLGKLRKRYSVSGMRRCHRCKCDKPVNEFPINRSRPDGYSATCLECKREYNKQHYKNNKKYYIDKASKRSNRIREWLSRYKCETGCGTCGERHPGCLHFHHRDASDKQFEICDAMLTRSMASIKLEMEKCDVLCANCHGKLHWEQRNKPLGCAGSMSPSEGEGSRFDSC